MNPGIPKVHPIIEEFVEFLYTVKGKSYGEISQQVGISLSTVHMIAKRRGFIGKRGQPQNIDESLETLDGMFTSSLHKTSRYMQNEAEIDEGNFHRHVRSQGDMMNTRKVVVETRAYDSLRAAMEALKDLEKWLKKNNVLSQETCQHALEALTIYQEVTTQESISTLKGIVGAMQENRQEDDE